MREGIFDATAIDIYPLSGTRQAGSVVADELLAKLELPSFEESQKGAGCQRGHDRASWLPCVAHLDHDRAVVRQELDKLRSET